VKVKVRRFAEGNQTNFQAKADCLSVCFFKESYEGGQCMIKKLCLVLLSLMLGSVAVGAPTTLEPNVNDPNLAGYWKFDEGTGTTAYDASGHGNNGTLTNGPTYTTGKMGAYALSFDGNNDYINIPHNLSISANNKSAFSIFMWIKTSGFSGEFSLSKPKSAFSSYALLEGGSGKIRFRVGHPVDSIRDVNSVSSVATNNWILVGGVFDRNGSGTMKIFVNGISENQASADFNISEDTTNSLRIGFHYETEYFTGLIDDARIYNKALSAAEVLALYNATNK